MLSPCTPQTAFKIHHLTAETDEIFLSLRFQCPKTKSRVYAQNAHQNYHVLLLSVFVLAFFLILEWSGPVLGPQPLTPIQQVRPFPVAAPAALAPGASHGLGSVDPMHP